MALVDYDRMAAQYDAGRALSQDALAGWREALTPYLPPPSGLPLLDLGSGTGRFSAALADGFAVEVIGIEPSRGMRGEASRSARHPGVFYAGGHAEQLPLRERSCGVAWLSTMIHHVPDLVACARELRRVLVQDGRVLIRSWFPEHSDDVLQYRYFPEALRVAKTFPSIEHTEETFAAAGFWPEAVKRVPQISAPSLRVFAERVRTRADTTLELLSDEEFERGMAELDHDVERETTSTPIVNTLDLLVLR